jgi:outer membrane protein
MLAVSALTNFASAQTIVDTLVSAYQNNPEINSARAAARANDEAVPIAKSGYRPIVSLFSNLTAERSGSKVTPYENTVDGSYGLVVTQNLFTGFRVRNAVRGSEADVLASHELLENVVQNVLFDAAQAYFDIARDGAILDLRESNVIFLEEQVGAANDRYQVGEGTVTDVAQAQARLAQSRADVSLAAANLQTSRATYREIVGSEIGTQVSAFPYSRLIPGQLEQAIILGQNDHPVILATIHQADAQGFAIKGIEGELLPTVSLEGQVVHDESFETNDDPNSFSLFGRISIPIYQGGAVAGRIRQAKERYGQARIEIDLARDQVRTAVISAWA